MDTILEALCSLPVELRSKIRWKIGGKGPDSEILKRMVEDSPIADQVELLGFVPDEEIPKLYASADVFALCTRADEKSSNIEGFGLVFLESQSSGTPVIGTPFGGIPSAVENGNGGWLVSDVNQLRSLFQKLICKPGEFQSRNAIIETIKTNKIIPLLLPFLISSLLFTLLKNSNITTKSSTLYRIRYCI